MRLNDLDKGINLDFNFDLLSHVHIPIKDQLYMKEYFIKFFLNSEMRINLHLSFTYFAYFKIFNVHTFDTSVYFHSVA